MGPLRIMRVIARMNVGGPAVEITELMRGLDPDKFEQRLFTGWCADGEADYLETQAPDVEAIRISGLGRSVKPWDDLKVLMTLTREIRRYRPDIVHTHTAKAGVLGRIAAKLSRTNPIVIHTYHGHLLHGYFGASKTRLVVGLERILAKITHQFVSVGVGVRDDLIASGIGTVDQYTVIYSGVSLGKLPEKSQARSDLGIPTDFAVVLMLGRITGIKRPDRFAEMVEIIKRANTKVAFLVAGSGDKEDELKLTIKERGLPIHMLGWRSDIENLLAASDIMVLTSDNEGTPLSLVQAGLAGIPVVATDVGSVSEVVHGGVTGFLTATTAQHLADSVMTLLNDQELAGEFGRQGHALMTSRFLPEAFIQSHKDLYTQSLLSRDGKLPKTKRH